VDHAGRDDRGDPHGGGVRWRGYPRVRFLRADYAQDELIEPDRDYRPYLTGPQAIGGRREYGEKVAGTWEREVARALVISP
jgi:hypothetical protein